MSNDVDNDNYENNVSAFLEKDNVHLGPYKENETKENKNENNNNNNKKNEKENQNKENNYVLMGKENSKSKNSELMSETELLRMSMNEEKKKNSNKNDEKEEKGEKEEEKEKEIKEENKINEQNQINNEENENENENKEIEEVNNEENEEKENKEEYKEEEEENISYKGSESLINSIVGEEIEEMPKDDIIVDNKIIIKRPKIINKIDKKQNTKYKTLKDLEKEPFKRIKIDSPRSLKIIQENGYTKEELYYLPLDKFLFTHKETINMNKSEQKTRFNFYEQLRINKIKKLSELRDILIQEESKNNNNNEIHTINRFEKINENNNNNNNSRYKTVYLSHNNFEKIKNQENDHELIKKIIIENEERIRDNKIERIKAINQIELANLVEYELDKNLFKMELNKQNDKYTKEIKRLKYEEFKEKDNKKVNIKLKNSGNNKPVVNKFSTFNENLMSFHVAKRIKEYDIFQQKLEQKLEKIEMANKKKNENFQMKKKMEYERAKINLKKSTDKFNRRQNELIKKMQIKRFNYRWYKKNDK